MPVLVSSHNRLYSICNTDLFDSNHILLPSSAIGIHGFQLIDSFLSGTFSFVFALVHFQ